jgi:hypothetical protein
MIYGYMPLGQDFNLSATDGRDEELLN